MGVVTKFKATFPKHRDISFIYKQMENGFKEIGEQVKKDFERTTKTWQHPVTFTIRPIEYGIAIGTSDAQYVLVNNGAPPHDIVAKNAPFLKFQKGFRPKTSPGFIGSRKGGRSGPFVYKKAVKHPGFEGRRFDEAIASKWHGKVGKILQVSIQNARFTWMLGYETIIIE